MNEEICGIANKGKTAKKEWENYDSEFLRALYSGIQCSVYIKN